MISPRLVSPTFLVRKTPWFSFYILQSDCVLLRHDIYRPARLQPVETPLTPLSYIIHPVMTVRRVKAVTPNRPDSVYPPPSLARGVEMRW